MPRTLYGLVWAGLLFVVGLFWRLRAEVVTLRRLNKFLIRMLIEHRVFLFTRDPGEQERLRLRLNPDLFAGTEGRPIEEITGREQT